MAADPWSTLADQELVRARRQPAAGLRPWTARPRSHIDSLGPGAEELAGLARVACRWRDRVGWLVALVPIEHWSTSAGRAWPGVAAAVVSRRSCRAALPGFRVREALRQIRLAQQLGCGIDLHIDERCPSGGGPEATAGRVEQEGASVPITCSHLSGLGLAPAASANASVNGWRQHIKVVALP